MKNFILVGVAAMLSMLPVSAEIKLSDRLTRIANHLGDGGVHFSVTDSKDELKKIGQFIDQFIDVIPQDVIPPGLRVDPLLEDLGLHAIEGRGASSHQIGDLWHSRSFVLTNGEHKGLLSLLGDEAKVPAAHQFAPEGADLVLETSLDLREIERTLSQLSTAFGQEAKEETSAAFQEKVTSLGLSFADIFVDFTVRGTVVIWLDDEKTFELSPETELPVPHFAARLENAPIVWNFLKAELGENSDLVEKNGDVILIPKDSEEETPFGPLEPRFVWNKEKKELFFCLTEADLAVCRGDSARVTNNENYKRSVEGLPEKGNGLAYVSKDLFALLVRFAKEFAAEVPPEAQELVKGLMPYVEKLSEEGGYASAFSVEEDGFLFAANLPYPVKGESSLMGVGGIASIAALSGLATPMVLKSQKAGEDTEALMNLKIYAGAQLDYQRDFGVYAESVAKLVEQELLSEEVARDLAKAGFEIVIEVGFSPKTSTDILAVIKSKKDEGKVLVAGVDGSGRILSIEAFEAKLAKQRKK